MAVTDRAVPVRHAGDRRVVGKSRPPSCGYLVGRNGLEAVVTVTGRCDRSAVAALADSLEGLITAGERHVVVDLARAFVVYDALRRAMTGDPTTPESFA